MLSSLRRQWVEALLAGALGVLCMQLYWARRPAPAAAEMVLDAADGTADMSLRNADFPRTHVAAIDVDLTSPNHFVRLTWAGPQAARQESGPFRSSPGRGRGDNNCDDAAESNRGGSHCTPKGTRTIEGFGDALPSIPSCKFVTWIHSSREIALHSHAIVPDHPTSGGCIRLESHAAQLIHNNAVAGKTAVNVGGKWTAPTAE